MDRNGQSEQLKSLYKWALALAVVTVVYNVTEGVVATYFGIRDETLTLFGFGLDSFVETVSALGVTQMVIRIRRHPGSDRGRFEVMALRITGWCFYVLALVLAASAIFNILEGHQPVSTTAGIIIAAISIITMWILIRLKFSTGKALDSAPIIADAKCNRMCLYMSVILLAASGLWWLWKVPHVDTAGALVLVYFCVKEGREAFEKAKGIQCHDCD